MTKEPKKRPPPKEWSGTLETRPAQAPVEEVPPESHLDENSAGASEPPSTESAGAVELPEIDLSAYGTGGETAPIGGLSPIGDSNTPPGCLTKEQFYAGVFKPLHDIPGFIFKFESLPIKAGEENAAIVASGYLYEVILRVPHLRFIIEPGNFYVQAAVAILAFEVPKFLAVREELRIRRMKMAEQAESRQEAGAAA